jgi:probable HAF family extracellular repeat protein
MVGLGDLAGGSFISDANAVNADGSVVVGVGSTSNGTEAFRWTEGSGMVGLGNLDGGVFDSVATGVNADGSVVVGQGSSVNGTEAFRWTEGTMVGLGDLDGGVFYSVATGVNADGSVVVGQGSSVNGTEAFRWTEGTMVGLGDLDGGIFYSAASAVNADGSVVVGYGSSVNGYEAFRWTEGTMVGLGDLDGGIFYSAASAVNADGSVVVGVGSTSNGTEAFRWTEGSGMVGLGDLDGGVFYSVATGVNADGSVVVGQGSSGNGYEAFRWTEGTGMQSVEDWLAAAGISMGSFLILSNASAVNADGSVVVGRGNSVNGTEAFLASISSGLVGLTDLGHSINQSYATSNQMAGLNSLILNGAHHRPLAEMAVGSGSNCAWVVGDLSSHSRQADGSSHLSEVGVCHDFKPQNLRIGVGIGASQSNLRLANDGRARLSGKHVLAEVDWQSPHHPILVSVLGTYGQWDADLTRGYAVTGTKRSKGETDVDAYSIRARVDWQDAFHVGPVGVSPRLAYTIMHTEIDGYQEDGGSAPANFKDQTHMAKEMRYGLTGKYKLSDKTTLLGHAEGVHRFDTHAARIKANINALGYHIGVNQEGSAVSQNWGRLGGEVDYQLTTDSRISFSTFVASAGEDADVSGSLSWQVAF